MSKKKEINDIDDALLAGDYKKVIDLSTRRVKWLYNNSNKNTLVIDEKIVILIVHELGKKIKELEEKLFEANMEANSLRQY